MHLILEGPDHAGKTSLARTLQTVASQNGLTVTYRHPGGPPADLNAELECMKEQILWLDGTSVILDRVTAISQQAYSPNEKLAGARQVGLFGLMSRDPVIVYCRPSTDHLMRKEDFTWRDGETEEHKQKIIERQHEFILRYDDVMTRVPHVLYDFEDSSAASIRRLLSRGFTNDPMALGELHRLSHAPWEC